MIRIADNLAHRGRLPIIIFVLTGGTGLGYKTGLWGRLKK